MDHHKLFSYERYNGNLGKQPTNNKAIEPQLMQRFLNDNFTSPCPQEFKEDFANFEIQDQLSYGMVQYEKRCYQQMYKYIK